MHAKTPKLLNEFGQSWIFFPGKKMNKVPPSFPLLENGGLPIVMQVYPRMYSGNNKVGIMERLNTSKQNKKVQLNA